MGSSAYNRGSVIVRLEADARMPVAALHTACDIERDTILKMTATIARLEHDLRRARRCIQAERNARAMISARLAAHESSYSFAVTTLCKAVFTKETQQ
mgnify:CR=1 FL=1